MTTDREDCTASGWRPEPARERTALARLSLLARAGVTLAAPLGEDEILQRLAAVAVPGLADAGAVDVLAADGAIERVAVLPPGPFALEPAAPHGAAIVLRTGEPEFVPRVSDLRLRRRGVTSTMCLPVTGRERPIAALTLIAHDRPFEAGDLEMAGELARRAGVAMDHARLYRTLEASEAHYRLLFDQSPLPMWVYDARTLGFLAVNDAAVRHYGYTRDEFLAMTLRDIRPPEDIPVLMSSIAAHGPGSPVADVFRHCKKDGTVIDVEISAGRITWEGRDASLVLAHDVSERRRLQERLAEAERMEAIGRLAGGVAHDFNNLLMVMSGYAALLLEKADEDTREGLEAIAQAAEQATALTRQLLAFSRRQVLHPHVLDLNEIIAGIQAMLHRIIGDDVTVDVRLAHGLAAIEADRAQVERVIVNLAANARDAMPEGGRLTIESSNVHLDEDYMREHGEGTPGPHVLLSVSDTGVGMSEDVRRHLFEPFFTTKEAGAGTGLGLATVFGVVKQSGGTIYCYSEEGRGTTFKIYFPSAGRSPDAAADGEPAAERGHETILVVEDDAGVRELVRVMLEGNGYRVLAVEGADEAARLCAARPGDVDLLLTDVVMPEVNGPELAERLAARSPAMRILFMSGYSDQAVYRNGMIGADAAFLEKPFSERALARKVREVLDGG